MRILGPQILDDLDKMADGSRQTIKLRDDERVGGTYLTEQLGEGKSEPCFWINVSQPAERSSVSCVAVACSSVERVHSRSTGLTGVEN